MVMKITVQAQLCAGHKMFPNFVRQFAGWKLKFLDSVATRSEISLFVVKSVQA
jgi:hypothetical protein